MKLRIGSRGSKLALWQAEHIRDRLAAFPGVDEVTLTIIKTTGDRVQDVALSQVGGKGLFTKEIEEALLAKTIDLAVHSMKDMPSQLPAGLVLAAVPERADPRDAWIVPHGGPSIGWDDLPAGAVVGTSSLRRAAQLRALRPDLSIVALRGNVDTRLRKLDEGVDGMRAIVLACAGLRRLGWGDRIDRAIPIDVMLPAVGQGALAIEARGDDGAVLDLLVEALDHAPTQLETLAERAFLARLEGGCQVPIAGHATLDASGASLHLRGFVGREDGSAVVRGEIHGVASRAPALGEELAERLLAQGARALLDGPG
ncbi:MAG: hydroxymethylbilane synthase [Myxococcota bacterium]